MIFIDSRAGSGPRTVTRRTESGYKYTKEYKGLIDFPPLNICLDCSSTFEWKVIQGEKVWQCSQSPNHSSLGQLTRLENGGDICFTGNGPNGPILIGVEVKEIRDLVSSLVSGRLQAIETGQIPMMLKTYDVSWLLYYGSYRENSDNGWLQTKKIVIEKGVKKVTWVDYMIGNRTVPYTYHEAFLCSPSFTNTGMLSKRVYDLAEAASWIGVLYRCWSKDYSKHKSMRTMNMSNDISLMPGIDPRTRQRALTAASFPGIKFERGLRAAQHFKSIREMVNADADEWAKIQGIGKVLGKAVEEAVK
jgi:hypothetical protein